MARYLVRDVIHYCNISVRGCIGIPQRKIDFYDFTFMLDGMMTYIADGEKIVLHPNDAILLKPGTVQSRIAGTSNVRYVSFNFYTIDGVELPLEKHLKKCVTENIRQLISIYPEHHLSTKPYSAEKCVSLLNYILFELLDKSETSSRNPHIVGIMNYIEQHITSKITLRDVSSAVNLSREYTSHIFRQEMHMTLTDYINERKMILAKSLILCGEMSLSDIAVYLGFENYSYFSRVFKKQFMTSPVSMKKAAK